MKDTLARMDASCNLLSCPLWGPESRGAGGAFVQLSVTSRVGTVRFVGFGTFNEEHANAEVLDEIEVQFFLCMSGDTILHQHNK